MKKCYSYIRFSSAQQSKGDSYRRQLEASRKYALDNNLVFDESLTIKDLAVSAYHEDNIKNGALGEFLDAIKQGAVEKGSILLVESLDRISRAQVTVALNQFLSILQTGVTIVTLQDNSEYSAASVNEDWTQLIISITYMARAHEEVKLRTERSAAAWKNKVTKLNDGHIWTSRVPEWLQVVDNKIEIIEDRVTIIKKIFSLYCSGYGRLLIAKELNEQNIISFRDKTWGTSAVKKILSNKAVLGCFTPKRKNEEFDEIPDYYPRIISDEIFYKAQSLAKSRIIGGQKTNKNTLNSIFSGVIFCGYCGKAMSFIRRGSKRANSIHPDLSNNLVCNSYRAGRGCRKNSIFYNFFEINFLTMIYELDLEELFSDDSDDDVIPVLKGKLLEQENKLLKFEKLIEDELEIPKMIVKKIQESETKIQEFKDQIQEQEHTVKPSVMNCPPNIIESLQLVTSDLQKKEIYELRLKTRQFIQQWVSKIEVYACPDVIEDVSVFEEERVAKYIKEVRKLPVPVQYLVEFKSGAKRHIVMDLKESIEYFLRGDTVDDVTSLEISN